LQAWFANLPEEDRTLAMSIDFTTIDGVGEAQAALTKAKEKAGEAEILSEVDKLKIDKTVFDSYVEGFAEANGELDKNANLTKQIALNNLKLQKGLESLTKDWDKNFSVIKKGNKSTLEYAKAIGSVRKNLKEMFGV
jgi:hypothetical protein